MSFYADLDKARADREARLRGESWVHCAMFAIMGAGHLYGSLKQPVLLVSGGVFLLLAGFSLRDALRLGSL
jgi:hypothetical protein